MTTGTATVRPVAIASQRSFTWVRSLRALIPVAVALTVWLLSTAAFGSATVPTPMMLINQVRDDGVAFYTTNLQSTAVSSGIGYLIGTSIAIVLGIVAGRIRWLTRPVLNVAMLSYTVPVVALGVVLTTMYSGLIPRIALAAIYVLFTTTLATVTGIAAASKSSLEVATTAGLGELQKLTKILLPSAIPSVATGLALAVPAAVLGAVVAEMLGGTTGVGVALVTSQRSGLTARTWAMAAMTAIATGLVFAAATYVSKRIGSTGKKITSPPRLPEPTLSKRALSGLISAVAIIAVWYVAVAGPNVPSFIRRTPLDVISYFASADASVRSDLWLATRATLSHAAIGFVCGALAAFGIAVMFVIVRQSRPALLPLAVFGQATPFVVILPLVVTVLGRGSITAATSAALVGFFPMLVTLDAALRRTPPNALDVMRVTGYGDLATVLRTRIPFAVPALIAAARIAVPASLAGAVLAEYLALDSGLGHMMVEASTAFDYDRLWAGVVILTCCSLVLGAASRVIERLVCAHLGLSSGTF